jgi:hypothetical protein
MPVLPPNAPNQTTALNIITDAMKEINILAEGETPSDADAAFALRKLNRILDTFNARPGLLYNVNFDNYTLTPNHQPHLIGPGLSSPDFAASIRPVSVKAANLILNNVSPSVNLPLNVRDDQWWANQRVQGLTSTIPKDVYYSDSWPNGQLFLWPVPTVAYGLQLSTWQTFTSLTKNTDAFTYPPGYWDAIVCSLAMSLCGPFEKPVPPTLAEQWKFAMKAVEMGNDAPPKISLRAAGIPGRQRSDFFDWLTGGLRNN